MLPSFGVRLTKNSVEKASIARITNWISEHIPTVQLTQIMVTELQCYDPDCVPVETLVIILGNESFGDKSDRWSNKILKPLVEVSKNDVEEALQSYLDRRNDTVWLNDIQGFIMQLVQEKGLEKKQIASYLKELAAQLLVENTTESESAAPLVNQNPDISTTQLKESLPASTILSEQTKATKVTMVRMQPTAQSQPPAAIPSLVTPSSGLRYELKRHYDNADNIPLHAGVVSTADASASAASTVSATVKSIDKSAEVLPISGSVTSDNVSSGLPKAILSSPPLAATGLSSASAPVPMTFKQQQQALGGLSDSGRATSKPRHNKDVPRQKGCPCCDPDNLDKLIDKMLFMEYPPN